MLPYVLIGVCENIFKKERWIKYFASDYDYDYDTKLHITTNLHINYIVTLQKKSTLKDSFGENRLQETWLSLTYQFEGLAE